MSHVLLRIGCFLPWIVVLASCAAEPSPAPVSEPPSIAAPVPAPAPSAPEEDEDEITGKSLYVRHCAGCHNDNGDGKGATMMAQGKQARSFAQGGFAFGNTVDQITKTIASGIPGTSLMQGFKSVMDEDEMKLVAEYVLTLTPYKAEAKTKDSVMVVGDRAVLAYGKLPPLHEGGDAFPRGLMIGVPGGLSFQFRIDDVRLLAVRKGAFADRTDWNDRGGGVLQPLGEIVEETAEDVPWVFGLDDQKQRVPAQLRLQEAAASEGSCKLTMIQSNSSARLRAEVWMGLGACIRAGHAGWVSSITLHNAAWEPGIISRNDQPQPASPQATLDVECDILRWPAGAEFVHGGPLSKGRDADSHISPVVDGWIVVKGETGFHAFRCFDFHGCLAWRHDEGRWSIVQRVKGDSTGIIPESHIERFHLAGWSPELLDRMSQP